MTSKTKYLQAYIQEKIHDSHMIAFLIIHVHVCNILTSPDSTPADTPELTNILTNTHPHTRIRLHVYISKNRRIKMSITKIAWYTSLVFTLSHSLTNYYHSFFDNGLLLITDARTHKPTSTHRHTLSRASAPIHHPFTSIHTGTQHVKL